MRVDSDEETEHFDRYQNPIYRFVSMGGAALIAVLGITVFAIGRTLDPVPPPQFFIIDAFVTVVLFVWYLLGLRCGLDVAETWVHIATKYGDLHVEREDVNAIEPDMSVRGMLQWSGRPLILRYDKDGKAKTRKAYGCLPNAAADQTRVVEGLQELLGRPEDLRADSLTDSLAEHLATTEPEDGTEADPAGGSDLAAAVAERLAHMAPEGDPHDLGESESGAHEDPVG